MSGWGLDCQWAQRKFGGAMETFYILIVVVNTLVSIHLLKLNKLYNFQWAVHFILYQLYLNKIHQKFLAGWVSSMWNLCESMWKPPCYFFLSNTCPFTFRRVEIVLLSAKSEWELSLPQNAMLTFFWKKKKSRFCHWLSVWHQAWSFTSLRLSVHMCNVETVLQGKLYNTAYLKVTSLELGTWHVLSILVCFLHSINEDSLDCT